MSTIQPIQLTQAQIDQFQADGYLIVPNLLSEEEIADFLNHESKPKPSEYQGGLQAHKTDPNWGYIARHANIAGVASQLRANRIR